MICSNLTRPNAISLLVIQVLFKEMESLRCRHADDIQSLQTALEDAQSRYENEVQIRHSSRLVDPQVYFDFVFIFYHMYFVQFDLLAEAENL